VGIEAAQRHAVEDLDPDVEGGADGKQKPAERARLRQAVRALRAEMQGQRAEQVDKVDRVRREHELGGGLARNGAEKLRHLPDSPSHCGPSSARIAANRALPSTIVQARNIPRASASRSLINARPRSAAWLDEPMSTCRTTSRSGCVGAQ